LKGFDEYVEDLAGAALLPGLSFMLQPVMPAALNRIAVTPATRISRHGGLLTCVFILTAFLGSAAQSNADSDARQKRGGDQRQESFRIVSKPGVDSFMVSKTDHRYK
jgi:hypothetical protein